MPPGSSARTAAAPAAICIDARFLELASVKNSVPCSNSNAASTSFGEIPGPFFAAAPAASEGGPRSSGAGRDNDPPRATLAAPPDRPRRQTRARCVFRCGRSRSRRCRRSTRAADRPNAGRTGSTGAPDRAAGRRCAAAAPRGRRRDREARARLESYREDWPDVVHTPGIDGRQLNGHCRRQNLMRLIALLLTAMLIGPAAAAQTATSSSPPSPASSDVGREGCRGPRFSGFTRENSRRAGARISRRRASCSRTCRTRPCSASRFASVRKSKNCWGRWISRPDRPRRGASTATSSNGSCSPPSTIRWPSRTRRSARRSWPSWAAQSAVSSMLAKYVAKGLKDAYRAHQLQTARAEVDRAIAEYCAGKENGGAGIQICEPPASPAR